MKGPCLTCPERDRDKNRPVCVNCKKRQEYIGTIGPAGMPISDDIYLNISRESNDHQSKKEAEMNQGLTKQCSKCGAVKPVSEFHKNRAKSDGLECWCKECKRSIRREIRKRHKEKLKAAENKIEMLKSAIKTPKQPASGPGLPPASLILDFSKNPDLLDALKKTAGLDFRTPELQALYFISKAVSERKGDR